MRMNGGMFCVLTTYRHVGKLLTSLLLYIYGLSLQTCRFTPWKREQCNDFFVLTSSHIAPRWCNSTTYHAATLIFLGTGSDVTNVLFDECLLIELGSRFYKVMEFG